MTESMRRRGRLCLCRLALGAACAAIAGSAQSASSSAIPWFDRLAARTLPIGNGAIGAVVHGGVLHDRLQFNEKSLWTGGLGSVESTHINTFCDRSKS
jgi:alpha-L-fucosidase 2